MSSDFLFQILISGASGGIIAFLVVTYKTGRYVEKIEQIEKCNLNQRLSTLEGKWSERKDITAFLQTKSPISLTEAGNNLLIDSGGKKFVEDHKDELIKFIRDKNPKSAYDIQEYSKEAINTETNKDAFTPLKDYLFKTGIALDVYVAVLSIKLRDLALQELGFDVKDLDIPLEHEKETSKGRNRSTRGL